MQIRLRFRILPFVVAGLGLLMLTATIGITLIRSQEPIRVKVNLVSVAFVARDERGALVDNLTQDDVDVVEDAIPQKVAFFSRSADVPLTLGVVVDASGSQNHFSKQHKSNLEVFFKDVLGPKDRVFLVGFENHIRLVCDFSQSGTDLLDDWKKYQKDTGKFPELGPKESRDLGTAFYDSIFYSVTDKLARSIWHRYPTIAGNRDAGVIRLDLQCHRHSNPETSGDKLDI